MSAQSDRGFDSLTAMPIENRRDFIKNSFLLVSAMPLVGTLIAGRAMATSLSGDCPINLHLHDLPATLGPGDAFALSSSGVFHHYHFLKIPRVILENIPAQGWSTLTSLMVERLGIADRFFEPAQIRRQFHCHFVDFTASELNRIRIGQRVEVIAYILNPRTRQRERNHSFVFNDNISLEDQILGVERIANRDRLRKERQQCLVRQHGGVRVFSERGEFIQTQLTEVNSLILGRRRV